MSEKANHHKINYIEFHSTDIERTKKFYATVFGWSFVDYGPDYVAFHGAGIDGGFIRSEAHPNAAKGEPLVVLYSSDLAATEIAVRLEGGGVVVPTFEFPAAAASTSPTEQATSSESGRSSPQPERNGVFWCSFPNGFRQRITEPRPSRSEHAHQSAVLRGELAGNCDTPVPRASRRGSYIVRACRHPVRGHDDIRCRIRTREQGHRYERRLHSERRV
jgi:predicted enzyme related to lactoylglutathione lyase